MPVYKGNRTIDGVVVTKDGENLSIPKGDERFLPIADFEWGYVGEAPRILAQVLLYDHFGDMQVAEKHSDLFVRNTISLLENEWELNSSQIDAAVEIERES